LVTGNSNSFSENRELMLMKSVVILLKQVFLPVILVSLMLIPLSAFSQSKVGTSGLQFLQVGVGARAFGMAEAFIAIVDDATALYYNPAGIALLEGSEAIVARTAYPADINIDFVGFTRPLSPFDAVGASFTILSLDEDIDETDINRTGGTGRKFRFGDYSFGLSYARQLTPKFSVGITLKGLFEGIV
jgi:long-subunit fatty acid transport protein